MCFIQNQSIHQNNLFTCYIYPLPYYFTCMFFVFKHLNIIDLLYFLISSIICAESSWVKNQDRDRIVLKMALTIVCLSRRKDKETTLTFFSYRYAQFLAFYCGLLLFFPRLDTLDLLKHLFRIKT